MPREHKPRPLSEDARTIFCEKLWQDLRANLALSERLPKPVFDRALDKIELPPALRAMSALTGFRDGIAVMSGYGPAKNNGVVDFYDEAGRYIATTTPYEGPLKFFFVGNNHLYTVGYDLNDAVVVHGYQVIGTEER